MRTVLARLVSFKNKCDRTSGWRRRQHAHTHERVQRRHSAARPHRRGVQSRLQAQHRGGAPRIPLRKRIHELPSQRWHAARAAASSRVSACPFPGQALEASEPPAANTTELDDEAPPRPAPPSPACRVPPPALRSHPTVPLPAYHPAYRTWRGPQASSVGKAFSLADRASMSDLVAQALRPPRSHFRPFHFRPSLPPRLRALGSRLTRLAGAGGRGPVLTGLIRIV